jgi:polar amino acid transport system permease protein
MSLAYTLSILPQMLAGTRLTVELLLLSWIFGNVLAVATALARSSRSAALRAPSWLYIQVIRGTPLLVQIYLLYYGLGSVFAAEPAIRTSIFWPILRDGFWYAVVALGISTGAYSGEILRGALAGVPPGEIEAGRALGLHHWQITRLISLPRAIQACLPALGGETILLLKSTALASTIAILDVIGQAEVATAESFRFYEPLLVAAVIYILLTLLITRLFAWLEWHVNRDRRLVLRNAGR